MKQVIRKGVVIAALFTAIATYSADNASIKAQTEKNHEIEIPKELAKVNENKNSKPFVRIEDNYLFIHQSYQSEQTLNVKIYYDSDDNGTGFYDLIYTEKIESSSIIKRVYQLDKNEAGRYKLVLTTEGKKFIEKFYL